MSWIPNTDLRCENYDLDPDRLSAGGGIRIPVNQIFWAWPDMVQVFIDIPSFVQFLKFFSKKSSHRSLDTVHTRCVLPFGSLEKHRSGSFKEDDRYVIW
jgi:hypothetical protein